MSGITVERALTGNVTCCLFRIQTKAMALEWHLYAFANTSSIFPSSRYHLPPLSNTLTESAQFSSVNSPPSAIFPTLVILDLLPRRPSILSQRLPPHARHGDPHYPYQSMLLTRCSPFLCSYRGTLTLRCGCVVLTCACMRGTAQMLSDAPRACGCFHRV